MIANDYSLQWRKTSFEGEARTRGVAQVAYSLTGGAKRLCQNSDERYGCCVDTQSQNRER